MIESSIEVLYVSKRAESIPDDQVVDEIALPSIRRNRLEGITGCLWFDEMHYVQAVEGSGELVQSLIQRIQADTRHSRVRIVRCRPIGSRRFERFSLKVLRHLRKDEVSMLPHMVFAAASSGQVVSNDMIDACVSCLTNSPQSAGVV